MLPQSSLQVLAHLDNAKALARTAVLTNMCSPVWSLEGTGKLATAPAGILQGSSCLADQTSVSFTITGACIVCQ